MRVITCIDMPLNETGQAPCPPGTIQAVIEVPTMTPELDVQSGFEFFGVAAFLVITGYIAGSSIGGIVNMFNSKD